MIEKIVQNILANENILLKTEDFGEKPMFHHISTQIFQNT